MRWAPIVCAVLGGCASPHSSPDSPDADVERARAEFDGPSRFVPVPGSDKVDFAGPAVRKPPLFYLSRPASSAGLSVADTEAVARSRSEKAIRAWHFPQSSGKTTLNLPFKFSDR
jgi:hypothetical protein